MRSVLFPCGSFYPAQTGGPDNTIYWITKALKGQSYDPLIVTTERGLQKKVERNEWLETDYGKVIYTKNLIHYLPLSLIFKAVAKIRRVDVIHLAMIFYPASFLIALLNRLFYKKTVVWSVHGDLDPYMLKRSSWKKRPVLWLIRNFLKKGVLFHATCQEESNYLKDNFGDDIEIVLIPNYMEFPELLNIEKKNVLLFIGRIDPKKAIENLIKALPLSKLFLKSDFVLKIVGDHHNPYGEELQKLALDLQLEDRIEFVGHAEGMKKQIQLAEAKFSFMPSHTENCGIVAMEAMAQSTPVVASKGTPWEILEKEKAGFWVDNSPQSLAKSIDKALAMSPDEYKDYSFRALKLANKEFNIYEKINEWKDAYEQVTFK